MTRVFGVEFRALCHLTPPFKPHHREHRYRILGALGRDCTSALAFHTLWLSSGAASGLAPGSPEHLGSPAPGGTWPAAPVPVTVRYPGSSLRASWMPASGTAPLSTETPRMLAEHPPVTRQEAPRTGPAWSPPRAQGRGPRTLLHAAMSHVTLSPKACLPCTHSH